QLKDIPMSLEVKTFEDILKSLEFLNKMTRGV
ncbi:sugar phosphate isomerase/epimerase, partial [Thermococci archaeon]